MLDLFIRMALNGVRGHITIPQLIFATKVGIKWLGMFLSSYCGEF